MITKLKDYILDEIPTKEECEAKKRNKTEYCFTLEYENDSDFIIKRTTPRSEKLLVVLVSQGQVYIKDVKANTIEKVEDIKQVRNFKKGLTHNIPFVKLQWSPFMFECSDFKRLLLDTDVCKELMNRKLNPFTDDRLFYDYRIDKERFNDKFERVKALQLLKPDINISWCDTALENMRKANITYNQIKDNLDLLKEFGYSSFIYFLDYSNHVYKIFDTYKCEFKALLTWLTYTMKHRNRMLFESSYWGQSFNVNDYIDYLEMQYQMYGKCKEKYPENWLTEKHIMNQKHKDWKKLQSDASFKIYQESLLDKVSYENKTYKVVVPITNTDILDEADQQRHCVASYIDKIVKGETNIVFIRNQSDLEKSLLTVEIRDNSICQVRGHQNRMYTKEEYDFMKSWAKKTGLKLDVQEVV